MELPLDVSGVKETGDEVWPSLFPVRPSWGVNSGGEMLVDALALLRVGLDKRRVSGGFGRETLVGALSGVAKLLYGGRWPVSKDESEALEADWGRAVEKAVNLVSGDKRRLRGYGRVGCWMSLQEARGIPARWIRWGLVGAMVVAGVGGVPAVVEAIKLLTPPDQPREPQSGTPEGEVGTSQPPVVDDELLRGARLFTLGGVDSLGGATEVWGGVPEFRVFYDQTELLQHDNNVSLVEFSSVVEKLGAERGYALPLMGEIFRSGFGAGMVVVKEAVAEGELLPFARNLELRLPEGKGMVRLKDVRRLSETNDYPKFSGLRSGEGDRIGEPLILCGRRDCAVLLPLDYDYAGYSYHSPWRIYPAGGGEVVGATPGGAWMRIVGGYWYDEDRKSAIATDVVLNVYNYLSFRSKDTLRRTWNSWLPSNGEVEEMRIREDTELFAKPSDDFPLYWYDVPENQLWPIVVDASGRGLFDVVKFSLNAVEPLEVKVGKASAYPFAVGPDGSTYPSTHALTKHLLNEMNALKDR